MSGSKDAPKATRLIRAKIREFMEQPDPNDHTIRLRKASAAIYAFYDFDDEPIYVGQTAEGVGARIGRHLTGQRSDAVAKFVLDPFEVAFISVWTLPQISALKVGTKEKRRLLNPYESTVYQALKGLSRFNAVLNEAVPETVAAVPLPTPVRGCIIPEELWEDRAHADVRIARRANHVGRLSQLISEREPSPGLRRTLHLQTQRLEWLSRKRISELGLSKEPTQNEPHEVQDEG